MPLISVIIPVFNVENYIVECFESFIKQFDDEIEVICVDDGSTDKSGIICDEYKEKYNNHFKVIHNRNIGIGGARNFGLKIAKGEYIAWIDPDDYISENWYKEIKDVIKSKEPDILFFDYILCRESKKILKNYANKSSFISTEKFLYDVVKDTKIQSQLWQKVFKKNLFDNISFPENVKCMEDYAILHKLILKAKKIFYINKALYFYRVRNDSLVMKVDIDKSYQCYLIAKERYEYLKLQEIKISKVGYLLQALGVCINYYKLNCPKEYFNIYKEVLKVLKKNFLSVILSDIETREKIKIFIVQIGIGKYVFYLYKMFKVKR